MSVSDHSLDILDPYLNIIFMIYIPTGTSCDHQRVPHDITALYSKCTT